jgi:glycosyltransferase involved in cell wall biosynthesis
MRLSIGVPAYNQGSFLGETLESLLQQDVPFHEIVVSNNHSADSTAEVLREFEGRVRVVTPPTHLTMAGNWNFTISQLTGEWVSLLSSDDLALPNFARSVGESVAGVPDAVLFRAAWIDIDAAGNTVEERHLLTVRPVSSPPRTIREQRFGPKGSFAAFALRRDIWQQVGGFPEEVTLVGDWGMWLLAGALGKTVYCDRPIAKYRAGHQPGVIRARHHIHAREMHIIYSLLMPRATRLARLGEPGWIEQASRTQFRRWVSAASNDFAAEERGPLIEAMRPWAESVSEQKLFRRFEQGDRLRSLDWAGLLRPAVRCLAARFRSQHR